MSGPVSNTWQVDRSLAKEAHAGATPTTTKGNGADETTPRIKATPFVWIDPAKIPPRRWLYGRHYIRSFISETVAPGAYGKSTLAITEALAICTGRTLLGVIPDGRANVWYWNGEDPLEELERRLAAAYQH